MKSKSFSNYDFCIIIIKRTRSFCSSFQHISSLTLLTFCGLEIGWCQDCQYWSKSGFGQEPYCVYWNDKPTHICLRVSVLSWLFTHGNWVSTSITAFSTVSCRKYPHVPECIFSTEGVFCTVMIETGFRFGILFSFIRCARGVLM